MLDSGLEGLMIMIGHGRFVNGPQQLISSSLFLQLESEVRMIRRDQTFVTCGTRWLNAATTFS